MAPNCFPSFEKNKEIPFFWQKKKKFGNYKKINKKKFNPFFWGQKQSHPSAKCPKHQTLKKEKRVGEISHARLTHLQLFFFLKRFLVFFFFFFYLVKENFFFVKTIPPGRPNPYPPQAPKFEKVGFFLVFYKYSFFFLK